MTELFAGPSYDVCPSEMILSLLSVSPHKANPSNVKYAVCHHGRKINVIKINDIRIHWCLFRLVELKCNYPNYIRKMKKFLNFASTQNLEISTFPHFTLNRNIAPSFNA